MRPLAASLIPGRNEVARKAAIHVAVMIFLMLKFILFRLLLSRIGFRDLPDILYPCFVEFIVIKKKGETLAELCFFCVIRFQWSAARERPAKVHLCKYKFTYIHLFL